MESKSEGRFTFEVIHALISRNEYPSSFSKEDKRSLRRRVKCFDAVDGELYYVGSTRKRQLPAINYLDIIHIVITIYLCLYILLHAVLHFQKS